MAAAARTQTAPTGGFNRENLTQKRNDAETQGKQVLAESF
jgi:hypothetical protein